MNDEKKTPFFTDDELRQLKENVSDHDRHFLPKPEEFDDESKTNDK